MKRKFAIISLLAVCSSLFATTNAIAAEQNSLGTVSITDLVRCYQVFNGISPYDSSVDLNGDGVVNVVDYTLMRRRILKAAAVAELPVEPVITEPIAEPVTTEPIDAHQPTLITESPNLDEAFMENLQKIEINSTIEQVHSLLGEPDEIPPTGIYSEIYNIDDNKSLTIVFKNFENEFRVFNISIFDEKTQEIKSLFN